MTGRRTAAGSGRWRRLGPFRPVSTTFVPPVTTSAAAIAGYQPSSARDRAEQAAGAGGVGCPEARCSPQRARSEARSHQHVPRSHGTAPDTTGHALPLRAMRVVCFWARIMQMTDLDADWIGCSKAHQTTYGQDRYPPSFCLVLPCKKIKRNFSSIVPTTTFVLAKCLFPTSRVVLDPYFSG